MIHSLHDALRRLRGSPGFSIAAILSLALGIGATTSIFTLLDVLVFRHLPVRDPDRLIQIAGLDEQGRQTGIPLALLDLLRRYQVFEGVCGFNTSYATVEMQGGIASRNTHAMTGDCFETLGVKLALGRAMGPADDAPGAPTVTLLAYDTWQREFGGRLDVVGQDVTIDGARATIVGVTQRGFRGLLLGFPPHLIYSSTLDQQQFLALDPTLSYSTMVFARLKHDDSIVTITARLETMWPRLLAVSVPAKYDAAEREHYLSRRLSVTPASTGIDYMLRDRFEHPLVALFGVATLVLLVSCVNVANLLLARALAKRREVCVRLALGAGRWILIRDALMESVLLLVAGVGAGIMLAYWSTELLVSLFAVVQPGFALDVSPEARTLSFACAAAVVAFLVFAIAPALRQSRGDVTTLLNGLSTRVVGDRARMRHVLVVAQVALTLTLVTGAVLFATALAQLRTMPLGLTPEGVLGVGLTPLPGAYQNEFAGGPYYRELIERMRHLPGVQAVALAHMPPLLHPPFFDAVGISRPPGREIQAERTIVTDGFLPTMGISLVAGTDFGRMGRQTVIVSESVARALFGARNPLGEHIRIGQDPENQSLEIIGVARDAIVSSPQARNKLIVYDNSWRLPTPWQQWSWLMMRTDRDPGQLMGPVRRELQDMGREYPNRVRALTEDRDASLAQERLLAWLSATFGWVGLTLAAIGLYGLLSFSVTRRTGEIGLRMALGAERAHIFRLVTREALVLIVTGVAIGLPLTLAGAHAVRTLLYGVGPFDVTPLTISIAILIVVGALATWIPANRAASVAPSEALRSE